MSAIIGEIQGGKTATIIRRISESDELSVVVVRNACTDAAQFMKGCQTAGLAVHSFTDNPTLKDYHTASKQTRVFVVLANACNVRKCMKDLNSSGVPFRLFVDEADRLLLGDDSNDRGFRQEFGRMQMGATELVLVTATTFNFMALPEYGGQLSSACTEIVRLQDNYCGMTDILFGNHRLADRDEAADSKWYIDADTESADKTDRLPESYVRWVRDLISEGPDRAAIRRIGQPVLALARLGHNIATIVKTARKAKEVSEDIVVVVFTGEGVAVSAAVAKKLDLKPWPGPWRKQNQKAPTKPWKRYPGFVVLQKLSLLESLDRIRTAPGLCGPESTVLICAGILAARGVNFCDSGYRWALTHEYLLSGKGTPVDDLQQALRLLGNKPWSLDDYRPRIMTKFSTMNDIAIGLNVHRQAVGGMMEGTSTTLMDAIADARVVTAPSVRYAKNLVKTAVSTDDRAAARKRARE